MSLKKPMTSSSASSLQKRRTRTRTFCQTSASSTIPKTFILWTFRLNKIVPAWMTFQFWITSLIQKIPVLRKSFVCPVTTQLTNPTWRILDQWPIHQLAEKDLDRPVERNPVWKKIRNRLKPVRIMPKPDTNATHAGSPQKARKNWSSTAPTSTILKRIPKQGKRWKQQKS